MPSSYADVRFWRQSGHLATIPAGRLLTHSGQGHHCRWWVWSLQCEAQGAIWEPQMPRELRRLAAIVSADVAGYSRLMGRDESGTLAALKALRREVIEPKISEHSGRIVKTIGD